MKIEDFSTQAWKRLSVHATERITALRISNDNSNHDIVKTAFIRGSIDALNKILALADEASASDDIIPGLSGDGPGGHEDASGVSQW